MNVHPQAMADAAKAAWSKAGDEYNANPSRDALEVCEALGRLMRCGRARKLLREALNNA